MHKLVSIEKIGKEVYLHFIDDVLKISDEAYVEINLEPGKYYDVTIIKNMQKSIDVYHELERELSIKPLSVRRTRQSLDNNRILTPENKNFIINRLIKNGILDDERLAKQIYEDTKEGLYGRNWIGQEFIMRGIGWEHIKKFSFPKEQELEKARKYYKMVAGRYTANNLNKQRQKIYKSMLKRGFDSDVIQHVFHEFPVSSDDEINKLKKDMAKIITKDGLYKNLNELNKKHIINELLKLGYSYRDIIDNLE